MAEFRYAVGDKVLVVSDSILYEVKCLKRFMNSDNLPIYYIHYQGWNKKYDEWVYENLLLDFNETNFQRMMSLKKKEKMAAKEAKVLNKKKKNLKRSNQLKESSKSSFPSLPSQTSKKPIDFPPKGEVSKMLVTEASKEVQIENATTSSFYMSRTPTLEGKADRFVVGNNLNNKPETNEILTSNTTGTTRNNSLVVSRMAANEAKVLNKKKKNLKRSNQLKESGKSSFPSLRSQTSKKPIDFSHKVEVSKMLVTEASKEVQFENATTSSFYMSRTPTLEGKADRFVVGNNLNNKPETNEILTSNTTGTTRNNSLVVSRMAANEAKVLNKKKKNLKRSNQLKESGKSSFPSLRSQTSKKPIDFPPKVEVSKMLVTEASKEVQFENATTSSFYMSRTPTLEGKADRFVVGNNLNNKPETNEILTSNTAGTTRNNPLVVSRKRAQSTRNQQQFLSDQVYGVPSKRQGHGRSSDINENTEIIDLTTDEPETERSPILPSSTTKIITDCISKFVSVSSNLTLNIFLSGNEGLNDISLQSIHK